jgi:hypothetical protein
MERAQDVRVKELPVGFQQPAEFAAAVAQAWCEIDLDPTLNGNPAMSPSGQTCCACY